MINKSQLPTPSSLSQKVRDLAPELLALCASSALSIALLAVRMYYTGRITYVFLAWNLILAWIPLLCAGTAFVISRRRGVLSLPLLPLLALWLLFFPNSPYILTDLLHLAPRDGAPHWYDLVLILSFTWSGLMLGFTSLWLVQMMVSDSFGRLVGWLVVFGTLGAGAFGIYLGRFLRWNSWDIIAQPQALLSDVLTRLANPFDHPRTLAVTLLLTSFLTIAYATLTIFTRNHPQIRR